MQKRNFKKLGLGLVAFGIPLVLLAITYILAPGRITMATIKALLSQATITAILAWGALFSMRAGTMDLAIGAKFLLAAILGGNISQALGWGNWGALGFCIITGLLLGLVDGMIYRYMKLPTIVISIAVTLIYEGLSQQINGGRGVTVDMTNLVLTKIPWNIVFPLVAFLISYFLYNKTKLGYHAKAIGENPTVAMNKGIDVYKTKQICYLVSGGFIGLYAFSQLMRVGVMSPSSNMGSVSLAFNVIMCSFLAMAMVKLVNEIVGILVGSLLLQVLQYVLLILGVDSEYQSIMVGVCVLIFLGISANADKTNFMFSKLRRREKNEGYL